MALSQQFLCNYGTKARVPVPTNPSSLVATPNSNTSVGLAWTPGSGQNSQQIFRSSDGGTTWTLLKSVSAASATYTDSTTAGNATYKYRLKGVNAGGSSGYATSGSVLTYPAAPTGLTANAISDSEIDTAWSGSAATFTLLSHDNSTTTFSEVVTQSTAAYADTGLDSSTLYTYEVVGNNATGTGSASAPASATTLVGPPAIPTGLALVVDDQANITLGWNAVASATSYQAEKSLDNSTWGSPFYSSTATGCVVSGLAANTQYYFRVQATNGSGASGYSSSVNATTAPAIPTGLTPTVISQSEIDLTWSTSSGATAYTLYQSSDDTNWHSIYSNTTQSFSNTGLTADTLYYYSVTASSANGESSLSPSVNATTHTPSGQDAIQQIQYLDASSSPISPNGGVFDLVFGGETTSDINFDDNATTIQADLEALGSIGSGNVTVTAGTDFNVEFIGALGDQPIDDMTTVNNTLVAADNAISVTTTTPATGTGLQCAGVVATADASGLSDGTTPFNLSCTYTPSAADIAGTNPGGSDGYFLSWGLPNSGTNGFFFGIFNGHWTVGNGSDVNSFSAVPAAGVSAHLIYSYDGAGNMSLTVDGSDGGTISDTFAPSSDADNLLYFGGLAGNARTASGVISNVNYSSQYAWAFGGNGNDSIDSNPATVTGSYTGTNQVDTIALDANVSGGTWELGGTTGIAFDDDGTAVQAAYDSWATANSHSAATITKTGAGTYTVAYATAGDQTAVTTALAAATFGDTLTQAVTVSITTTQIGG